MKHILSHNLLKFPPELLQVRGSYFSFVLRSSDFKNFVNDSSEANEVGNDELMSQGSSDQDNVFVNKPKK